MDGAVYLHSNIKYFITTKVSVFALLSQAKKEERRKRAQEMLKQANIRNVSTSFDSSTHTTTVSRVHFNCRINNSITYRLSYWLASFPGCGAGGGKRAWYTLFTHVLSSLGNFTYYSTTLKVRKFLFTSTESYSLCDTYRQLVASMLMVCIVSFKAISKLERERLCRSRAITFG